MDYKMEFVPFVSSLYKEFGFKYIKKDSTATLKKKYMFFEVMTCYTGYFRAMYFVCYVRCPSFISILHEVLGCKIETDDGTLIKISTSSAFRNEVGDKNGFAQEIVFSDGYPVEDRLSDEQVFSEFERLFSKFILPWFEHNSTLAGIRSSFRTAPIKTQTWNNLLYTFQSSTEPGGLFLMFYIDFMVGRLLNDEPRSAEALYRDEYERAYLADYDGQIDEEEGVPLIQTERIKRHFDLLPTMLSRLDAVTPEQWAEYRIKLGIEI
jgi:hypothetical protein